MRGSAVSMRCVCVCEVTKEIWMQVNLGEITSAALTEAKASDVTLKQVDGGGRRG